MGYVENSEGFAFSLLGMSDRRCMVCKIEKIHKFIRQHLQVTIAYWGFTVLANGCPNISPSRRTCLKRKLSRAAFFYIHPVRFRYETFVCVNVRIKPCSTRVFTHVKLPYVKRSTGMQLLQRNSLHQSQLTDWFREVFEVPKELPATKKQPITCNYSCPS